MNLFWQGERYSHGQWIIMFYTRMLSSSSEFSPEMCSSDLYRSRHAWWQVPSDADMMYMYQYPGTLDCSHALWRNTASNEVFIPKSAIIRSRSLRKIMNFGTFHKGGFTLCYKIYGVLSWCKKKMIKNNVSKNKMCFVKKCPK